MLRQFPGITRDDDIRFILDHHSGCNGAQLGRHLGWSLQKVSEYLNHDNIHGTKAARNRWHIAPEEIARVIDLERNWEPIAVAARRARLKKVPSYRYANAGYFGETRTLPNGVLGIKRTPSELLRRRFRQIQASSAKSRPLARYRPRWNKVRLAVLAKALGLTPEGMTWHARRRNIKATKQGTFWVTTRKEQIRFLQAIASGKLRVSARVRRASTTALGQTSRPT